MISVISKLRTLPVTKKYIHDVVGRMLDELAYADFDISITLTTDKTIRFYNATYRNKDKATDVLSFPHHPNLVAGKRIKVHDDDDKALGDIIISVPYLIKDAEKHGVTFTQRLNLILAHGICHLLGHDHIEDNEFRVMRRLEERLLRTLEK